MLPESEPSPIRLGDYLPPAFFVDRVDLHFDLDPGNTLVRSRLSLRANPAVDAGGDLVLDGIDLDLLEISIDERPLAVGTYCLSSQSLTVFSPGAEFTLETVVRINPAANTRLEGLYLSGGKLCTQCEAEGFRRITWFPDRPDVLARYQVTLAADRERFPVLLANGNLEDSGVLADGRHWARWRDPFAKPSYLFALVAGDLVCVRDHHRTMSGREIKLEIYVEPHNRDRCGHAMWSLKQAMAWDEAVFGLECDLDQYMIVAVDDFNMGAMENKGLNIFNSRYVLASPETATDSDFENITAVIGHEYFHNWTGNRVTCRDWFQLSLKEGLTVYRDQEFSAAVFSRGVNRIRDVRLLMAHQFAEDAGPLAHPVRPDEYFEINNFYTLTVYEKGAELVRLFATFLGRDTFIAGVKRYIVENDGTAATVEDFIHAMEAESGRDLGLMLDWYTQAGTPELYLEQEYEPRTGELTLRLEQRHRPSPGQAKKKDLVIPVTIGLLGPDGALVPFILNGREEMEACLVLAGAGEDFMLTGVGGEATVSALRHFSAPVRLRFRQSAVELARILVHDSDPFCRWRAGQELGGIFIKKAVRDRRDELPATEIDIIVNAWETLISQARGSDPDLLSLLLRLPDFDALANDLKDLDPGILYRVRDNLATALGTRLAQGWRDLFAVIVPRGQYVFTPLSAGRRRLAWLCLDYLLRAGEGTDSAWQRFHGADNMSDELAGLAVLLHHRVTGAEAAAARFLGRWGNDPLLVDKFLALKVGIPAVETLDVVEDIIASSFFSSPNPNRMRAVLGAFANTNPLAFHRVDGRGYRLLAGQLKDIDRKNPQAAARLFAPFSRWRRYEPVRAGIMRREIETLRRGNLSPDLSEMVEKSLKSV